MQRKDYEQLDVQEMERMVARAALELVDDPERPAVTFARLVKLAGLPKHRVREVIEEWGLRAVSGDEFLLTPTLVERLRGLRP
jgi:hypothetical protein